jgi:hypothetical protein
MRLAPDRPEKPDSEAVRAIADSGCNGHFRVRQVSDRIPFGGGAGDDGAGLPLLERIADPHHRDEALDGPLIRAADFPDGPAIYATCDIDGNDPQRSLLPLLLQRLSPLHRRLLWHRYLR